MHAKSDTTTDDSFESDVYHDGDEVCVRARSQHSRSKHIPKTDDDGNVVFDDEGNPTPKCEIDPKTDTTWVLRSVRSCENRDACDRCAEEDRISKTNQSNGGSKSWARRMRYGDDWGDGSDGETSSANASQASGD